MAKPAKRPVTLEELLFSSLAQTGVLAKLLIEKGLITRQEFGVALEPFVARRAPGALRWRVLLTSAVVSGSIRQLLLSNRIRQSHPE